MIEGAGEAHSGDRAAGIDTFVSYASQDAGVANAVVEGLEAQGLKCWIAPRDVTAGQFYAGSIIRAIDAVKALVLILSQNSASSPHVLREVERAVSKRHALISLRLDQSPLPADLEYFVNTSHWLDASSGVQTVMPRLIEAVQLAVQALPVSSGARAPDAAPPGSSVLKPIACLLGLILVAAVGARVWIGSHQTPAAAFATGSVAAPVFPASTAVMPAAPEKSVAVLPFVDMSEKHDQEYFSDGLSEELINSLTKVRELRVPARTSSFYFKAKTVKIAEIGRELGVANVLEGSIQKSGSKVRVTVQLVRVDTGYQLWSETYDRPLNDLFKVQDQISAAVVSSLKIVLLKNTSAETGTRNAEAHDLFLQAKFMFSKYSDSDSKATLEKVAEYLRRVLQLDPAYADAWVDLSRVLSDQSLYGYEKGPEIRAAAHTAAAMAIKVAPDDADPHTAMARILMLLDADWVAASAQARQALSLDPNNSWALVCEGMIEVYSGRLQTGIPRLERAASIDPISASRRIDLASAYFAAGRYAESAAALRKALDLDPSAKQLHALLAEVLLAKEGPAAALVENDKESDAQTREAGRVVIYYALGRKSDSDVALAGYEKSYGGDNTCNIARIFAYRGEIEEAFRWLDREPHPQCVFARIDPFFKILRSDPRFNAFLRKMNLQM